MDKLLDDLMREVERWERGYRLLPATRSGNVSTRRDYGLAGNRQGGWDYDRAWG